MAKKSTKKTTKKKVIKRPLLCYVCQDPNHPIRKSRDVYIQVSPRKIARHPDCYPGSIAWMESDLVRNNPEKKKYFETAKRVVQVDKIKKALKVKLNNDSHPGNDLLEMFYKTTDKKEKKKIRRQLRKKGIFISNLKNPDKAKQKTSKKKVKKL